MHCTSRTLVQRLPDRLVLVFSLYASLFQLILQRPLYADESSTFTAQYISSADLEFFEQRVRPLLAEHCFECHSNAKAEGGLRLDSRQAVDAGGESGPAIVNHQPETSRLIEAIRYENEHFQMPPKGKLSKTEIDVLVEWVQRGAPDPRDDAMDDAKPLTGMSVEEGRSFWSFKPIAQQNVPPVENDEWVKNPIDAFILARLESKNLRPASPADKLVWLRRVSLNLIGLPPTQAELDDFVMDDSIDAMSKVVERLLASPQYGVRWGRHWLDVARYADSNGLDENLAYGNAWRYRDYVVDSFNTDKPFNQFIIEQIAGDLIEQPSNESKTATGYLALGARVLAEPDRMKLTMDTIDEQIDSLGKTFLGLTLGCARCHDHKFDPILQRDYYALAAIFKSTMSFAETNTGAIKHWYEHSFATEEEKASLKKVDEAIATKAAEANRIKNDAVTEIRQAARAKAELYLAAATMFDITASLGEISEVAQKLELHPRILHHCRLHIHHHAEDPFLLAWHELQQTNEDRQSANAFENVRVYYKSLLDEANAAWTKAKSDDPKSLSLSDSRLEAARIALADPAGFLAVPPQPEYALDPETLARYYSAMEAARILESAAPDETAAMGVSEGEVHNTLPIHIRGSHRNLGKAIERGIPAVLTAAGQSLTLPKDRSGRLELARWLANENNPLTARVIVNRVWRWHFGQGLVPSTDNFGVLGESPSHPELLDWLAKRFIDSGWSIKELHRLILASNTYQMDSYHSGAEICSTVDPENKLLWRITFQRMEAEQIRDSVLFVSDRLDPQLGGKTVPLRNRQFVFNHTSIDHTKYDSLRRSLYLPIIRNNLYSLFEQFDFPDPTTPTGSRNSTTVAPQALLFLNDDLIMDSAESLAKLASSISNDQRIKASWIYRQVLSRVANESDIDRAIQFIAEMESMHPEVSEIRAWSLLCHAILASNEFIYIR